MPALVGELRGCADSLARHAAATEPGFLAMGNDLQALYRAATEMTRALEDSNTRLHEQLASQRLSGVDGVVAAAIREVESGVRAVEALLNRSRAITGDLSAMRPQLDAVNRVGVLLQSVAVGFAVESSRTAECQVAFGSFVEEIRGLSRRTNEVEARIGDQLAGACDSETNALARIESELTELGGLARQLTETSSHAASDVQSRLDDIVAALAAMRDRSVQVRQHTEEAVFHMQFGDIVRQKIEHVVDAISTAANALEDRSATRNSSLVGIVHTLAVQVAQLEAVEQELATAEQQLGLSFSKIAEAATGFGARAEGASMGGHGVVELRGVLADFDELRALAVREQQLREQSFVSGQDAFATAERIASQMKEVEAINREMHLLALNAIVKTAALGDDGATLEVLSMQVHELYRQADAAVSTIGAEAARLTVHRQADLGTELASHEADRALVEVVGKVSEGVAEYERTIEQIGTQLANNDGLLAAARGRLSQLGGFADQVRAMGDALRGAQLHLAAIVGPAATKAADASASMDFNYTMESEREIHRRIAVGGAAAAAPAIVGASGSLGRATASKDSDTSKAHEESADTGSVATAGGANSDTDSLGDNVELF